MKQILKKLSFVLVFFSFVFGFNNLVCATKTDENAVLESVPKLSIIMPIYNVAPYLDEALDSAENQTYKDLEIICVNDGSTDNSLEILEKHAEKDSRIRIISRENQGVSEARNVGLRASTGEYIYFCDSDDVMAPYAMEKAIENLEKYNADASEFWYKRFNYRNHIDLSKYSYQTKKDMVKVIESNEKDENSIKKISSWPCAAWCRVYRKSFLDDNKLCFNKDIKLNEDVLFNLCSKACMHKLARDSNVGYFYRVRRPGSIMNTDYRVINKRINGRLMIVHDLVENKDRFKFFGGKEYLFGFILNYTYNIIRNLKSTSDKCSFAGRAYEEVWTNFASKCKIKISKKDKNKLNDLKKWSQNTQKNKKVKSNSKKTIKK